ncbi:MAG: SDR family NAD(P)-dependent oxidoreductase [Actinomycetes bacterium]|jgi:NAD(P)-dependent dehydrogenase (short-subunit alcohol dehydrogenase family)
MAKKIAVVTGPCGAIGSAIVAQLIKDGLSVVGLDINQAELVEMSKQYSGDFTGIEVDLTDAPAIEKAFKEIESKFGGVDALVNNAGNCFMSEFPNIPAVEFELQMSINFSAAFHCSQAAVKLMLGRPGIRKIVSISSNGAYNFDVFDPPHYRASKAALDTLTKDLARRYANEGISVNSIAPAMTESPLFNVVSKEVLEKALAQMPRGHAMKPSEIAAWVGFLISPAGDVSSGNVIILNQGRDVR